MRRNHLRVIAMGAGGVAALAAGVAGVVLWRRRRRHETGYGPYEPLAQLIAKTLGAEGWDTESLANFRRLISRLDDAKWPITGSAKRDEHGTPSFVVSRNPGQVRLVLTEDSFRAVSYTDGKQHWTFDATDEQLVGITPRAFDALMQERALRDETDGLTS